MYNGAGYARKGRPSPYVLAGTQFYKSGKYVADGRYSASAVDRQLGIAPVMKRVLELTAASEQPIIASSIMGRLNTKREQFKEVVGQSRRLKLGERVKKFIEWTVASTGISFATIEQVRDFLIDWRSLAVLVALGGTWAVIRYQQSQTLREVKEGRYTPSGALQTPDPDGEGV
jgi:hypothetical protein